jgi:hypothetical protein
MNNWLNSNCFFEEFGVQDLFFVWRLPFSCLNRNKTYVKGASHFVLAASMTNIPLLRLSLFAFRAG